MPARRLDKFISTRKVMKQRLILVGSGQHCNVVIYNIKCQDKYDIACICDMNPENAGKTIAGYPIEYWKNDSIECMRAIENKYDTNLFFIAFGNMKTRKSVFEFCTANGWKSVNIIHPNAVVSSSAKLGKGILIEAGCLITPSPVIGNNVVVNTGSQVNHDNIIEDHVYMASGVVLSGGVRIGENTLLDDGVIVTLGKEVGKNSLIGAGAVVTKNIPANVIAYGSPCKKVSENNIFGGGKSVIIGAGTYGEVYLSYLQECGIEVVAFMDSNHNLYGTEINGVPVVGSEELLRKEEWKRKIDNVYCFLGKNTIRRKILSTFRDLGYKTPCFIHPSVKIANNVEIAQAVYILPSCTIMPFVNIEDYCMISMGAKVAHHSHLKQGCFLSTGVNFGANIIADQDTYIGIGATIMTGVKRLGNDCLVGAGSVVIRDVDDNAVVAGVPAKIIKYKGIDSKVFGGG